MSRRRDQADALLTGLVLIAVGVLFLLDRLHVASFSMLIRTWWPMIIVLVGLPKLFVRETVWSGLWLVGVGAWLEAVTLHLYGLTYRNSWPLMLIIVGAGITLRALGDTLAPPRKEERHEK